MKTKCPVCGNDLIMEGGCQVCRVCFWSACGITLKEITMKLLISLSLITLFASTTFAIGNIETIYDQIDNTSTEIEAGSEISTYNPSTGETTYSTVDSVDTDSNTVTIEMYNQNTNEYKTITIQK